MKEAGQIDKKDKQIRIVEIGSGAGGLAESVLSYFKTYDLEVYKNYLQYIVVEISEELAKLT